MLCVSWHGAPEKRFVLADGQINNISPKVANGFVVVGKEDKKCHWQWKNAEKSKKV